VNGFWLVVAIACTLWYSTVTIYVTIQGARDIRGMLERLGGGSSGHEDRSNKDRKASGES
jgi:hypothetical protein